MNHPLIFSKMHGLGNDFVVVDGTRVSFNFDKTFIKKLSHRHLGIGFDQLLLVEASNLADFACKIFNADGSEAEQCGNGMRCVARFVHEKKLTDRRSFSIATTTRIVHVVIHNYDAIEVDMGNPVLENQAINLMNNIRVTTLSMGNPHAILFVSSLKNYPVAEQGKRIGSHAFFPQGTNVGFVEIRDPQHIALKTFERGVGETFACGSNACAAVVAGIWNGLLDHKVNVMLELGSLVVCWDNDHAPVLMTGPAALVFDGELPFPLTQTLVC